MVTDFARLSGDSNPIHVNRNVARRFGLQKEVAHGAILLAEISRIIGMELPGPGALWISSEVEFISPTFVGDDIEIVARVMHESPAFGLAVLEVSAYRTGAAEPVLRASATVKILDDQRSMMVKKIEDQTVLVTGGTRGLGGAISALALERGAHVIACYRSDHATAEEFRAARGDVAERLSCVECDVSDPAAIEALFDSLDEGRPIDSVVHAASPPVADIELESLTWDDFEPFMRAYISGGIELVKQCLPSFRASETGRVVFVGSEAARQPRKNWLHYTAAKSALAGLARGLALELAEIGTTVNVVSPGTIHTSSQFAEGAKTLLRNTTPLKRLVTEEEVAEVVLFLLGAGGSFMTGTDIPLSGGRVFL